LAHTKHPDPRDLPVKKSELLRAGLQALQQLTETQLRSALDSLVLLKAGRPKKKAN